MYVGFVYFPHRKAIKEKNMNKKKKKLQQQNEVKDDKKSNEIQQNCVYSRTADRHIYRYTHVELGQQQCTSHSTHTAFNVHTKQ